jgi:prepilin-type N-terminal cleavage/methylation domain-containing protein
MNKGFTLIEMIVAVGIFAITMVVCLAAFVNINDFQKKAESLREINDNLNFSLETMMREIRSGSSYSPTGCNGSLSIKDVAGNTIAYRLNSGRIEKSVSGGPYIALTGPEVSVTNLNFCVTSGINVQPMVTIMISGSAGPTSKTTITLNLQTTISQRKMGS